ncbi:MAG: hypothetical protein IJT62_04375 [Oscillospiraceae bacterium]|nr:hypothetical protein [Oscillospiraceae bacterium]
MHALYNLKDMLCKELEEYGEQGELTAGSLEIVDKLAHAVKNLDKVIWAKEEEMGGSFDGGSFDGGSYDDGSYRGSYRGGSYRGSYRGSYDDGYSSRRGRNAMGRFTSRRGYSRAEDMAQQLKNLADQAPDERTKQDLKRLAEQMEQK